MYFKKMHRALLLVFFACCYIGVASAQNYSSKDQTNIFGLGVVLGVNNSQLDGDYFTGFNKAGLYGGLRGVAILTPRISLQVELLYSEKGSRIEHNGSVNEFAPRDRTIALSYAEVPLLLKYRLMPSSTGPFIELGGSVARLLQTAIEENDRSQVRGTLYGEIMDQFNSNDFSLLGGVGYNLGRNWELTLRYSFGLSRIYYDSEFMRPDPLSTVAKEVEFLRNYHLSLLVSYRIL